jgi:phage-related protein
MALDMTTALTIKAKVDGLGQIENLDRALGKANKEATGLSGTFSRLKGATAGIGGALGALVPAAGIAGLTALGKRAIDAADNLNDLSQRTGVAVPTLSRFGAAAEDAGSSIDEVAKGMGRLSRGIVDPASKTNEALKAIGISSTDAQGRIRGVDGIILDLADKFSKMPDGAEKTALAMELFGKAGMNLIPMLNGGREALSQYSATIDTEMAQAADRFNDALNAIARSVSGPFNEAVTALLPFITQLAEGIAGFAQWFSSLPGPVQTVVASIGALTAALVVFGPAIASIVTIFTTLGPLLTGIGAAMAGIPALIAGWAGAIGPLVAGLGTLGKILIGVFSGPVGWVALAVAAGVAIYAFRDQIGQAFQAIGGILQQAAAGFKTIFIDPVAIAFQTLTKAITAPFQAAFSTIRGIVNQILNAISSAISSVINAINGVIRGANSALARLRLPQIPQLPMPQVPRFAEGGVVSGPTLAMVGEGGEPEYIVPQSKASGFAANWMAGQRGAAAIPRFAEGGVVVPSNAQVSIQTGPVTQMNGANYVTTQDLSRAVQAGVQQTLDLMRNDRSTRRAVGLA